MVYHITVPMVPPSPNVTRMGHYMAKYRLRKAWKEALFYGVSCSRHRRQLIDEAKAARQMQVEVCVFHAHVTDDDNMVAALKPVLDGLKILGYIRDDSPECLRLALPVKQIHSKERKTVIRIQPADGA